MKTLFVALPPTFIAVFHGANSYMHTYRCLLDCLYIFISTIFPVQTVVWPSGFLLINKTMFLQMYTGLHIFLPWKVMNVVSILFPTVENCCFTINIKHTQHTCLGTQVTYLTTEHYCCNLSTKCFNFIEKFFIFFQIHHLCSGICASMQTLIGFLRKKAMSIGSCCLRSQ